VITVYASASFVIIELVGNLAEPMNLPDRLQTIIVILLAIGFPLAIILSWLYDLTSQGIERTMPLSEIKEGMKPVVPNAWKIATYVSFVVIVGLVGLNITGRTNLIKRRPVQSLVILPLSNLTGADSLNLYIEGLHSMLISKMQEITGLNVISKYTSDLYKNTDKSIQQITKECNVDAAMEFDVLCFGETICFEPRLMSGGTKERQLWNGDYSEPKGNLFNVYNQIVRQIADEVRISLTSKEEAMLTESRTIDPGAIDAIAYVSGFNSQMNFSHDSMIKAIDILENAIEKEPDWAPLYGNLALVWEYLSVFGYESFDSTLPKVYENINKALALDPDNMEANGLIAEETMRYEWNWEKAETIMKKALESNPSASGWRMRYSILLYKLHRPEEAKIQVDLAYRLDPLNPFFIAWKYAGSLLYEGDYASAMSFLENQLATDPDNVQLNGMMEDAAYGCGDLSRMFEATKHYIHTFLFEEEDMIGIEKTYNERGFNAAIEEIIRQLEIQVDKGHPWNSSLAYYYYVINQDDKAIEYFEKAADAREDDVSHIGTGPMDFSRLYDNPRFIDLLEKMNLPVPKSE